MKKNVLWINMVIIICLSSCSTKSMDVQYFWHNNTDQVIGFYFLNANKDSVLYLQPNDYCFIQQQRIEETRNLLSNRSVYMQIHNQWYKIDRNQSRGLLWDSSYSFTTEEEVKLLSNYKLSDFYKVFHITEEYLAKQIPISTPPTIQELWDEVW